MNRRSFLGRGAAAGAAAMMPRWLVGQAGAGRVDRLAQMRAGAVTTPIKTTKLYDNVFLLQGAGGNMAVQTGPQGKLLIDSSFSTATPRLREALSALGTDPDAILINTHWHIDHTDGNESMHADGFKIHAHLNTLVRLSSPQNMKLLGLSLPAAPAGARPTVTFRDGMKMDHNREKIELAHFAPAHTDSDILIHFTKANVLHVGDTFFNGFYPFIDEGSGGSIGGMIEANAKALAIAGPETKIVPGHGPLGSRAELQKFHDMMSAVRDKVAALKSAGASEQEAIAKKPTADLDGEWNKGAFPPEMFVGIVYRTL